MDELLERLRRWCGEVENAPIAAWHRKNYMDCVDRIAALEAENAELVEALRESLAYPLGALASKVDALLACIDRTRALDELSEIGQEIEEGCRSPKLLMAGSVRGTAVHARRANSRVALCGEENVNIIEEEFAAETPWACSRCLRKIAQEIDHD